MKKAGTTFFLTAALALTLSVGAAAAELIPGGMTVGLELRTDGVMVSAITDVETAAGSVSPAGDAGLRPGDCIVALNGQEIHSGDDFAKCIDGLNSGSLSVTLRRNGETHELSITPALSKSGAWQLGLRLRDGASGIGTITYYDPDSGHYGALGHGVNDAESGVLLPAAEGTVSPSVIVDVVPGKAGTPGELCGIFDPGETVGDVELNSPFGIFGSLEQFSGQADVVETAGADEVHTGPAVILSNIQGTDVEAYDIELTRVNCSARDGKSFVLKITDQRLLDATGGVICGMSGSPILQDGKLVGAVTHVLVNDPARGYGIFIDKMLETAA